MAAVYRALGICVIFTVLGQLLSDAAVNSITLNPSPPVSMVHGSAKKINLTSIASNATSGINVSITASHYGSTAIPSSNKTVMPSHNMTVMPSHNKTVMPSHNSTITPHNMTITPSHNMTVMPSHNKTVMPSHNSTITPHNMTITPSHNMTVMPHSKTIMPSHNMTIMPSSTHTVIPTSSAHPTLPPPKAGNFTVKENKTVCLFAYMAAEFDLMIDSKTMPMIVLPSNASANGKCGKSVKEPFVTLHWETKEGSYNFTMHFVKLGSGDLESSTPQRWAAANLTFSLLATVGGPVAERFYKNGPLNQLSADVGHAYECKTSKQEFTLTAVNSTVNVTLTDIDFQPFNVTDGHFSNKVEVCNKATTPPPTTKKTPGPSTTTPKPKGSHVVAIAVGCTLAGLVIIVAIGYLIGRRRSRNSSAGYRKL